MAGLEANGHADIWKNHIKQKRGVAGVAVWCGDGLPSPYLKQWHNEIQIKSKSQMKIRGWGTFGEMIEFFDVVTDFLSALWLVLPNIFLAQSQYYLTLWSEWQHDSEWLKSN